MLTQTQINDIVADFKAMVLSIENGLRLSEPAISEIRRQTVLQAADEDALAMRREAGRGDSSRAELAVRVMIHRHRLELNEFERHQLAQAFLVGGSDLMAVSKARLAGDFSDLLVNDGMAFPPLPSDGQQSPEVSAGHAEQIERHSGLGCSGGRHLAFVLDAFEAVPG